MATDSRRTTMTTKNVFWIVLADASQTAVTKRHADEQSARDEAERLVRKEGRPFFVAKALYCFEPQAAPVVCNVLVEDD